MEFGDKKKSLIDRLERNNTRILIALFTLTGFLLSFRCWDCMNLESERATLLHTTTAGLSNMVNFYTGQMVVLKPFLMVFGQSLLVVRIVEGLVVALTVVSGYLLGRELYGKKTGILFSLALVLTPTMTLLRESEWLYLVFFSVIISYSWIRTLKDQSYTAFGITGFLLGIGMYQKYFVAYVFFALFLATLAYQKEFLIDTRSILRKLSVFLILLLIGVSPLIKFSIESSVNPVKSSMDKVSGSQNSIFSILRTRCSQVVNSLNPGEKIMEITYSPKNYRSGTLHNPALVVALIAISVSVLILYGDVSEKFLLIMLTVLFLLTLITPSDVTQLHVLPAIPFFVLVLSRAVTLSFEKDLQIKYAVAGLLSIILLTNILAFNHYHSRIGDQGWVEDNMEERAIIHTEARRKINEIYEDLPHRFVMPSKTYLIKYWTKDLCSNDYIQTESETLNEIRCQKPEKVLECSNSTDKLVLPYPSFKKDGSDIWRRYYCSNDMNKSCFKPYLTLERDDNVNMTVVENLKDTEGKIVYQVLDITC